MILDVIFYWVHLALEIVSILPNWQIPDQAIDAILIVFGYALSFNTILPISLFFLILWYILLFEIAIKMTRIGLSVFNFFRGAGSLDF